MQRVGLAARIKNFQNSIQDAKANMVQEPLASSGTVDPFALVGAMENKNKIKKGSFEPPTSII